MPAFSPLSPARAQDFPRTIAGMMANAVNWKTPAEFRAWVSLTHELTHYLQDLTTGVGHYDHVARAEAFLGLMTRAKWYSTFSPALPLISSDANGIPSVQLDGESRALFEQLRARLLFVQDPFTPVERHASLASGAAPLLSPGGKADPYTIECLLEGEAAAVALTQVLEVSGATEEQWQFVAENVSVWLPTAMPDEYADLLGETITLMQHLWGDGHGELNAKERDAFLILSARLLGLLADLACAHPSAELLARTGADVRDYEPGLRFLRMLTAIGAMDEDSISSLFDAMRTDIERAEALLVQRCGYDYLPARVTYEDWATQLERMIEENPDDEIARLRAECCAIRLEKPDAWKEKSLWSLLDHNLPFYVLGPGGLTSIAQQWQHLEHSSAVEIYGELMWNGVRLGLHDLFFETGRFVCPLALARTCDAATDACTRGVVALQEFPTSPDCRVRGWLEGTGFRMRSVR